jgi:hypothetical protein
MRAKDDLRVQTTRKGGFEHREESFCQLRAGIDPRTTGRQQGKAEFYWACPLRFQAGDVAGLTDAKTISHSPASCMGTMHAVASPLRVQVLPAPPDVVDPASADLRPLLLPTTMPASGEYRVRRLDRA